MPIWDVGVWRQRISFFSLGTGPRMLSLGKRCNTQLFQCHLYKNTVFSMELPLLHWVMSPGHTHMVLWMFYTADVLCSGFCSNTTLCWLLTLVNLNCNFSKAILVYFVLHFYATFRITFSILINKNTITLAENQNYDKLNILKIILTLSLTQECNIALHLYLFNFFQQCSFSSNFIVSHFLSKIS